MAQLVADLKGRLHTREVGGQAVWSVTSAKAGNGVELLRDDRDDTYWQSDGAQPHLVSINFSKKVLVDSSTCDPACKRPWRACAGGQAC